MMLNWTPNCWAIYSVSLYYYFRFCLFLHTKHNSLFLSSSYSPSASSPPTLHPLLRKDKASHGESTESGISSCGRTNTLSPLPTPSQGWARYLSIWNGFQKTSSCAWDKSLSHCQWPHRPPKSQNVTHIQKFGPMQVSQLSVKSQWASSSLS